MKLEALPKAPPALNAAATTPILQAPPSEVAPPPVKQAPPPTTQPKPPAASSPMQKLLAMPRADRKQYMVANWPPPYSNIATVKAAYKSSTIDEAMYDDIVWALKMRRKALIQKEKDNYERHLISKPEYKQRLSDIDRAYEGQ